MADEVTVTTGETEHISVPIEQEDVNALTLEERITQLEKIVANFSITGTGISGNIEDGFTYNNPDDQIS